MSNKGKKYTAAEKHFHKKEVKYQHAMKRLSESIQQCKEENEQLKKQNECLQAQVNHLQSQVDTLIEISKMSEDEYNKFLKDNERARKVASTLSALSQFGQY